MDDDHNLLDEPLFDFSERLSLQTLAATNLSLILWRDKICNQSKNANAEKLENILQRIARFSPDPFVRRGNVRTDEWVACTRFTDLWNVLSSSCLYANKKFSCRDVIVVSTRIADLIDERIVSKGDELQYWLEELMVFHPDIVTMGKLAIDEIIRMFSIFFDNLVLNGDCTICLRSTVVNILMSTEIEIATTKYRMACAYCLENWIRELWPLVNSNVDVLERERSPMVMYWNAVMMNKSEEESRIDGWFFSISNRNWTAVEYFWDRWSNDEQTTKAIDVLRCNGSHVTDFMKYVLPKLNQTQLKRVCVKIGHHIFSKMVKKDEYFEYAEKLWIHMKDIIPRNVFFHIICDLWSIGFNPSEWHLYKVERVNGVWNAADLARVKRNNALRFEVFTAADSARVKRNNALLLEVWTTARDPLKRFVLHRNNFVRLFKILDDKVRSFDTYNLEGLLTMLANADYDSRHIAWLQSWRALVLRANASQLAAMMKLCLPDDKEIERFKEHTLANFRTMETYFNLWMNYGLFAELNEYLNFCIKNPGRLETVSKKIIISNLQFYRICDEKKFDEFFAFAHSTFCDSPSVTKFMNELLSSEECWEVFHYKLYEGCFNEVIRIVTRFPATEEKTSEMKRMFLNCCHDMFTYGYIIGFVKQDFENFLAWCSSNKKTTNDFKQSLNVDDIFDIYVKKRNEVRLINLRASKYHPMFVEMYSKKWDYTIEQFLLWAYDGDTNKIAYFKELWKNGSVSYRTRSGRVVKPPVRYGYGG